MPHWLTRHAKALAAAALALLCAALGAWLRQPSSVPGAALVRTSYDSYFAWFDLAQGTPSNAPVTIVYLDLASHQRLGLDPSKPWPRALHARLLHRLQRAGARAVVFDIVFDVPGPEPAADVALAEALRAQGRVVLAAEMSVSSRSTGTGSWPRETRAALPIRVFRDAAAAWGLGELGVDDDFVARLHFPGRLEEGEALPSLTWATAGMLGLPLTREKSGGTGDRWFRYYGPPFTLPHIGFNEALEPGAGRDAVFRDKVVFVGARPMAGLFKERRDEFRNPFYTWFDRDQFMPGVEVHATQLLNLLQGDWLTRPAPGIEWLGLLLTGAVFGAGLLWLRPVPAALAAFAGGGLVVGAAVALFRQTGLWFPWLIVVAAQIPVALGGSVLFNSLEWYRARRRLEAAKRVADARIREQAALIDKAHDAIFVQALDGRITYANPSAERLYGWSLEELGAGGAPRLFRDPAAGLAREAALERGEWNGELRQETRSGKSITAESRWTLLRDAAGQPAGLLVINSDVTEKKQLEAESLRMQRMEAVGALAGGMAHDLNNALAPVLMGTQLLRRDATDENARRILALMESSTRRGADMVRQVLLFARGRQGDFERLDVRPLVKEIEKLARDTFPQNIAVSGQVAADLWPVRGNATQLHQVLLNLCINARDAMPAGGSLSLAADNVELTEAEARSLPDGRAGAFVVVIVSDTGAGIPPDVLPKVFEPFFTTKAEGRGTGLGLSTSARIVKAHEGFISLQSQPGSGTTFEIYLPRYSESAAGQAAVDAPPPPGGRGELILVADDDEAVREVLRRSLEDHGYRVVAAANGAEALSLFKAQAREVTLFISDQSMPLMDGAQAVSAVRRMRGDLPVLFLSGDGEGRAGASARGDGDDAGARRLGKPIELDLLLRTVRALLDGRPGTAGPERTPARK